MVKRRLQVCGRLLTVCIVIYRYVLVLHSSLVETSAQKRMFQCLILATIFLLPVLNSSYGVYYRNQYHNYLGEKEESMKPSPACTKSMFCRMFKKTSRVLLRLHWLLCGHFPAAVPGSSLATALDQPLPSLSVSVPQQQLHCGPLLLWFNLQVNRILVVWMPCTK